MGGKAGAVAPRPLRLAAKLSKWAMRGDVLGTQKQRDGHGCGRNSGR